MQRWEPCALCGHNGGPVRTAEDAEVRLGIGRARIPWTKVLGSLQAVNHPRYSESIDKHAKADSPEGLL